MLNIKSQGKKPIVGVMPLYDDEKNSLWMLPGYLDGIYRAGGIPLMFPLDISKEDALELYNLCSGILLTGGHDINPKLYNEEKKSWCGVINRKRDELETLIFKKAYNDNKPLLGICRGIQLINALMEGTLYQDINMEIKTDKKIEHHMSYPYDREAHKIKIVKGTPLYTLFKKTELPVNSYHHQGIKKCGKGLIAMAFAEDGLVEAVCCKRKAFIWGIQWHPEFYSEKDTASNKIFSEFVKAMTL